MEFDICKWFSEILCENTLQIAKVAVMELLPKIIFHSLWCVEVC